MTPTKHDQFSDLRPTPNLPNKFEEPQHRPSHHKFMATKRIFNMKHRFIWGMHLKGESTYLKVRGNIHKKCQIFVITNFQIDNYYYHILYCIHSFFTDLLHV